MPRRRVTFARGEHYHVYNRGNNRQPIFFERENYLFFLRKIRQFLLAPSTPAAGSSGGAVESQPLTVLAYCLMPNHYHLLVRLDCDNFSDRMQSLGQAYVNAVNRRFERVGSLFQGPFQARHVDDESYLLHLSRYIHLNPSEARLVAHAEDWEFSSYPDYIGLRAGTLPRPSSILYEFGGPDRYRTFVESRAPNPDGLARYLIAE